MPLAPPRACVVCGRIQCRAHLRPAWRLRDRATPARIRGRALQQARAALLDAAPWCVHCLQLGLRTRATIRDHRVPLAEGGADGDANVQGLCQACSDAKTADEARRGRAHRREM